MCTLLHLTDLLTNKLTTFTLYKWAIELIMMKLTTIDERNCDF